MDGINLMDGWVVMAQGYCYGVFPDKDAAKTWTKDSIPGCNYTIHQFLAI